jgi:hypothetical protein
VRVLVDDAGARCSWPTILPVLRRAGVPMCHVPAHVRGVALPCDAFDIECYNAELGRELETFIENKRAAAHRVTLEEVDGRPWPIRLPDGVARLFVPYL